MTNKHQAGIQIARQLRTTEHAVDDALAEMFRLGARMIEGRKAANLAAALTIDASNLIAAATMGAEQLGRFKTVQRPKTPQVGALKALFEMLELNPALLDGYAVREFDHPHHQNHGA